MKTLSLFSGCLGLDLGLEALGFSVAAYVECDEDCLRLIADRRPDARVVTDVRSVSAELVDELQVEVVAGGFPCQDLSYAGRGAGLDGDRSGLWFEMIRVIRDVRPRLVLVENVPGLLTRGLHVVLHDLATAGYVGRWFAMTAASTGAPHLRERIFIVARRADISTRIADELGGGHETGLYREDGWFSPQESLFDPTPILRLGKRGRWTLDAVYEDDHRLALDDDSDATLLPTPNSSESTPTDDFLDEIREADLKADARLYLPGRKYHVQRTLSRVVPLMDHVDRQDDERLLPTPGAWLGRRPENAMADPERAASRQHEGTRGKRSVELPDALAAEVTLLPTPAARDGKGANPNERDGGLDLPGAIDDLPAGSKLLPTPVVTDSFGSRRSTARTDEWKSNPGTTLTDAVWEAQGREEDTRGKLLPTPSAALADGGQKTRGGDRQDVLLGGIAEAAAEGRLLPTPQAVDGSGGRLRKNPETLRTGRLPSGAHASIPLATALYRDGVSESVASAPTVQWGVYELAVRRWESVVGPAPLPTDEKGRLSPWFVEWMMGFDDGWTALDGISRTARLRLLGNAVHVFVGERAGAALLALDRALAAEAEEACA